MSREGWARYFSTMGDPFDDLVAALKALPGLGKRSAERIAVHLLVGDRERLAGLMRSLEVAGLEIQRCPACGNLARTGESCAICEDSRRNTQTLCVVEKIQDLVAIEAAGGGRVSTMFSTESCRHCRIAARRM